VRELEHEVAKIHALTRGDTIEDLSLLTPAIGSASDGDHATGRAPAAAADGRHEASERFEAGSRTLEATERAALVRVLRETKGNKDRAARILGVSRSTVYEMIRRHAVGEEEWKAPSR
jgi:DNA-binding NtrC family response regulator